MNSNYTHIIDAEGNPCISLIIPLQENTEGNTNNLQIRHSIEKTWKALNSLYDKSTAESLKNKLLELSNRSEFSHKPLGIGCFVSEELSELVYFPFPVKEKLSIGKKFLIRDLLYLKQVTDNYFILAIDQRRARLFRSNGGGTEEFKDSHFPVVYDDDYEYSKPSRGNSYSNNLKGFEKDKSTLQEMRLSTFLKKVDTNLDEYLGKESPLIVNAVTKELALFESVTAHKKNIAGKIEGKRIYKSLSEIKDLAEREMEIFRLEQDDALYEQIEKARNSKRFTHGLKKVWSQARLGKGLLLILEKDYTRKGYLLRGEEQQLYTTAPETPHIQVDDAVEEIIRQVLAHDAHVRFVPNLTFEHFRQIALIERYH